MINRFGSRVIKLLTNPAKFIMIFKKRGLVNWLPDKLFLKLVYKANMGKKLNLSNLKTYNEKLQWLKIYDRRPEYIQLVDKYQVRNFVSKTIGEEYLIPLLGVWDSFDEINFDELPDQFVLKCSHDSGGLIICKDKEKLDKDFAKAKINKCLKKNYYYVGREWPYKNVKPRVICEKYLADETDSELKDYRFFCFDGEPRFIAVDFSITDKSRTRRNLYDLNWQLMDERISYPRELTIEVPMPKNFDEMIELSRVLSKDIPHVRVDFYNINGKIYFGELTFFHQSGFGKIEPKEFDLEMGSWIKLPHEK